MNYFDKLQQNIIREEFARAAMINKAKSVLNESQFNYFMNELRDYETNLVLTESNQNEMKYSGLAEQLVLNENAMQRIKNLGKGLLDKIAPDNQKKLEQLTAELDMLMKGQLKTGEMLGDLAGNEALKVKAAGLVDQIKAISPEAGKAAAEAYGIGAKGSGGGAGGDGDVPDAADMAKDPKAKAAADKVEAQADAVEDRLENPKAKGIFSSIVDSYKYAFAANASMWKNVFGFFTKAERSPPPRQDDMMMQLLLMLLKQMQGNEIKGEPQTPLTPKNVPIGGDPPVEPDPVEKEKKVITVRSVQRPIINVVQRVAADQGVDVSVKQAQDIAIAITKNLVNQMRANGVEFKGVTKDLKESFMSQLNTILNEESLSAKLGIGKQKLGASDLEGVKGMKQRKKGQIGRMAGAIDPADYIKLAKAVIQKYDRMGLASRSAMEELEQSEEPNEFVDFYDTFRDIQNLRKYYTATLKLANDKEKNQIESFKKKITAMGGMYQRNTGFTRASTAREFRKKFIKMKKEIKGIGKKEKAVAKDLSLAGSEEGKVNISKTVAKAVQAGGLSPDVAKKITPILKKKVQGIIAKHMDADVKYLEEKINRYVKAVIKEVK